MSKHVYPEFHKALLETATYPAASRRIKFEETRKSYLYRTGEQVYKIRKTSPVYSTVAVKERFAQLALELGRRWCGQAMRAVVPIARAESGYVLGTTGEVVDYALVMEQLPESAWLYRQLDAGKVTPTLIGRLAKFVAEQHQAAALDEKAAEAGRPEHVQELLGELAYQSKKYVGVTVTDAMLDMITRPLGRYFEELRRVLTRRGKRGRIVDGHGALVPEHLHIHGTDIHALAPLEAQPKYRVLDAANDVALLLNALELRGHAEHSEAFVKRYVAAAKDRDLPRVLPIYRILQALRAGMQRSEWTAESAPDSAERATLIAEAGAHYTQALHIARELHKPIG